MKIEEQKIPGLLKLTPSIHKDVRGEFFRAFCLNEISKIGFDFEVKQTNVSVNNSAHTLRGFHYQAAPVKEAKVITCVSGAIHNVVIDLREGSPTYLEHQAIQIDSDASISLVVPAGCANAFLTLADNTLVYYLMSEFFEDSSYYGFRYDDPFFGISWPVVPRVISERDLEYKNFIPRKSL